MQKSRFYTLGRFGQHIILGVYMILSTHPPLVPLWLLLIFVACAAISLLLCGVAKTLFPKFRSGEHKPGTHRPDMPIGGREIKTIELPLVGGPAMTLAIVLAGLLAAYLLEFDTYQLTLLFLGLGATVGYTLVGFIDDWNKVYSNEGIAERTKFTGVILVGMITAALYFFLLPSSGQEPYSFWKDLPILNAIFCTKEVNRTIVSCSIFPSQVVNYLWLIFLMALTGCTGAFTSLSVDFSDGMDGLAGGLVFSTALALGIVVTGIVDAAHPGGIVLEVMSLLCAGAVLGYLPRNWPSSWSARRGTAKRRSSIIMGDSGALGLGGMLAMIAIFSRNELLLLMIGGAFVLEGASALISARIMTRFFRKNLQILRFANTDERVPHTEFPLPFLATPLHHHFDLLGWDRRRLVYGAWALGAVFSLLGVMVSLAPLTWERYLGRILVLVVFLIVWSSGSWTKCYFIGKHPAERVRRRRLALYYGYPFRVMGIRLYHLVEIIDASEDVIETPSEESSLWQRINIFDARSMLGLYCYRAGYYPAALAQWTRIPERNRVLRPEINRLLAEVDMRLALEKQETQPMRRDQISRQEPIIAGNLPPADLPNPYEPVGPNEAGDENHPAETWNTVQSSTYPINDLDEEKQLTGPLKGDGIGLNSGQHLIGAQLVKQNGDGRAVGATAVPLQVPQTRTSWLARLLRSSGGKNN
jgi:UDP-N-acetylmuramyl pentapeptide phosphotransferase/UDP-N-acetylglucosamine-1-phosphate transferase